MRQIKPKTVYALVNSDGIFVYVGQTSNPIRRAKEHQAKFDNQYEFFVIAEDLTQTDANFLETHFITSRNCPKHNISPGPGNSTNRSDWTKFKTSVTKQAQTYQTGPVIDLTTGNYYRNKSEACAVLGLNTGNLARHLAGELKSCGGREFSYFN